MPTVGLALTVTLTHNPHPHPHPNPNPNPTAIQRLMSTVYMAGALTLTLTPNPTQVTALAPFLAAAPAELEAAL